MKTLILIITLGFSSISLAGQGHSHGGGQARLNNPSTSLNIKSAKETGQLHLERLIKLKKIDSTWSEAVFDKAEKKTFGKKTEWLATFTNKKGVKGEKIYIFLKMNGEFIAANFTGK